MYPVPQTICDKCDGTGKAYDHQAIGRQLRKKREKRGVSLRTFAGKLGLSAAYLSDLELGRRNWTAKKISAYEGALG